MSRDLVSAEPVVYQKREAKNGASYRVGLMHGAAVVALFDLAKVFALTCAVTNELAAESVTVFDTVDHSGGPKRRLRAILAGELPTLQRRVELWKAGQPGSVAMQRLDGLPTLRWAGGEVNGRTFGPAEIPVVSLAGKAKAGETLYFRMQDVMRVVGVSDALARHRFGQFVRPSVEYTGAGEPPRMHALRTEVRHVQFGGPGARKAGRHTAVWPVDLLPLMLEALATARRPGRPCTRAVSAG